MPHKFDSSKMEKLISEERLSWQDPVKVLNSLGLQAGETLIDVGCGPGFFTIPASRIAGADGKVFAVDISLDMLMRLGQRIYSEGIINVTPILSRETNIPLADGVADAALLADVLHEAEDPVALLVEVRRLLREGGRLLIVDWIKEEAPVGPPEGERIAVHDAAGFAEKAGLKVVNEFNVGPYHWALLLST